MIEKKCKPLRQSTKLALRSSYAVTLNLRSTEKFRVLVCAHEAHANGVDDGDRRSRRLVMAVAISARKVSRRAGHSYIQYVCTCSQKTNWAELREAIVTQAELLDLRGGPNGMAEGVVIKSRTQRGIG